MPSMKEFGKSRESPLTTPCRSGMPPGLHPLPNFGAGTVITAANCADLIGNTDDSMSTAPAILQNGQVTLSPLLLLSWLSYLYPTYRPSSTPRVSNWIPWSDHHTGCASRSATMTLSERITGRFVWTTISPTKTPSLRVIRLTMRFKMSRRGLSLTSARRCPRETSGLRWLKITFSRLLLFNAVRFSFSRTNSSINLDNIGLPGGTGPQLVPGFDTGVVDMNGPGGGNYAEFGSVNAAPHDVQPTEHLHPQRRRELDPWKTRLQVWHVAQPVQ